MAENETEVLSIDEATRCVAYRLGLLMLVVHETPPHGALVRDDALRARCREEESLARDLAALGHSIVRASSKEGGRHE